MIFFRPQKFETVAAVDLGSNSFHMIVARPHEGGIDIIDRIRETVRLGDRFDPYGNVEQGAAERALACLDRFGQRLRHLPQGAVRAVGTNALRRARNAKKFIALASQKLGHPIEIISGIEEARLIYLGVIHDLAPNDQRRLVIDIGGGSTELIVGEKFNPKYLRSLNTGCVSLTQKYFPDGRISKKRWRKAEIAVGIELEPVASEYKKLGWQQLVGSSGTIRAIERIIRENNWAEHGISYAGLRNIVDIISNVKSLENLPLKGVNADRLPVLPGGVVVLATLFETLKLDHMEVSDNGLREGLLYDLVGRIKHQDIRERTIQTFAERYNIDTNHAERVKSTVNMLLKQIELAWEFDAEEVQKLLNWAAQLYEVGLQIAQSGYHRHGAYILDNADMPGFSRKEQHLLSILVRFHRRKIQLPLLEELSQTESEIVKRMIVLLRLAVILNRSRSPSPLPEIVVLAKNNTIKLLFAEGWLDNHSLSVADLELEAAYLHPLNIELEFS